MTLAGTPFERKFHVFSLEDENFEKPLNKEPLNWFQANNLANEDGGYILTGGLGYVDPSTVLIIPPPPRWMRKRNEDDEEIFYDDWDDVA